MKKKLNCGTSVLLRYTIVSLEADFGFSYFLCSPRWLLNEEVPKIVKSINRQLREKSVKTKVWDLMPVPVV